jgi:hypothetical protein
MIKFKVAILFLGLGLAPIVSASTKGLDLLLKWELNPVRTLYLFYDVNAKEMRFHPIVDMKDVPAGEEWYIENNSYGLMAYNSGFKLKNQQLKKQGLEIFDFAMKQQLENGEFGPRKDFHHSVSFYYETLSHFLILSKTQGYADGISPEIMQRLRTGLRKGVIWFAKESSWKNEYWRDTFHHRFLLCASVVLMAQKALGDLPPETLAQAYHWINIASQRQLPDGVMTEKGGHDTGYQSLGIIYATGMLMVVDLPVKEKKQLELLTRRGADWLANRISAEGLIDETGNTRMGGNSTEIARTTMKKKDIKPYETAFALYGASYLFNDMKYQKAADRIMKFYKY